MELLIRLMQTWVSVPIWCCNIISCTFHYQSWWIFRLSWCKHFFSPSFQNHAFLLNWDTLLLFTINIGHVWHFLAWFYSEHLIFKCNWTKKEILFLFFCLISLAYLCPIVKTILELHIYLITMLIDCRCGDGGRWKEWGPDHDNKNMNNLCTCSLLVNINILSL